MAYETSFRDVQVRSTEIGIRTIRLNDLAGTEGRLRRLQCHAHVRRVLAVLFPPSLLLTLLLVWNGKDLLHLAFQWSRAPLIGPAVRCSFELSRRRERGLDARWRSAFDFVHTGSFAYSRAVDLMTLLYLAWLFMAQFPISACFWRHADLGVVL
jgi:hypothetical protein